MILFYILNRVFIKDYFVFVLCIYALSFFQYAIAQGGAFNILAFSVITFHSIRTRNYLFFKHPIKTINIFIYIIILSHILGVIFKNDQSIYEKLIGTICLFGFILTFNLISRLFLTPERVRYFIYLASSQD